jgi:hypothetical protein
MKNLKLFCLILTFGWLNSCTTIPQTSQPEILTAQYEFKTHSETERGYEVFLVIDKLPASFSIKGIILKSKLYENIQFNKMDGTEIFIEQYFPLISQKILNFIPPKPDSRPDGIIFEIDGKEFFKEINFKLKQ